MANKIAVAFALVITAGACTCVGALLAFFARLTNRKFLAASLGGAAGVMMYISLVEILPTKSVSDFAAHLGCSSSDPRPFRYATLCFFGGILVVWALDILVHTMLTLANRCSSGETQLQAIKDAALDPEAASQDSGLGVVSEQEMRAAELLQAMPEDHRRALTKMGLLNMLAIGLHNLPEGLVTFIGYYNNPKAGVGLAIAVALHNIPEGIVVGMPIYFASGSRLKALGWTAVSGLFEIIGGIIGYAIVTGGSSSPIANAIMFGLVSGIMVYISAKDLIPTALKYDPDNQVTSNSFLLGAVVMAVSLILLGI